ncbi:hypothetical protein HK405_008391, partial [Cladochytrium tenue]
GTENDKYGSRHSLAGSQTGADAKVVVSASQRQSTTSLRSGRGDPAQEAASENDDSHADGALRSRHPTPGGSQRQSTASLRSSHGAEQQGMTNGSVQNEHGARRDPAEATDEAEIHDGWSHDETVEKSLSRKGTSTRGAEADGDGTASHGVEVHGISRTPGSRQSTTSQGAVWDSAQAGGGGAYATESTSTDVPLFNGNEGGSAQFDRDNGDQAEGPVAQQQQHGFWVAQDAASESFGEQGGEGIDDAREASKMEASETVTAAGGEYTVDDFEVGGTVPASRASEGAATAPGEATAGSARASMASVAPKEAEGRAASSNRASMASIKNMAEGMRSSDVQSKAGSRSGGSARQSVGEDPASGAQTPAAASAAVTPRSRQSPVENGGVQAQAGSGGGSLQHSRRESTRASRSSVMAARETGADSSGRADDSGVASR